MKMAGRVNLQYTLTDSQSKPVASKVKPVLKWAGGKQQMLDVILPHIPEKCNRYIEPFLGGGALYFSLAPQDAVIADSNPELINLYQVLVSDVELLIEALRDMPSDEDTFYAIRGWDANNLSLVEQAARTIYLNRTCFNGLYRVNRKGQFNVPYGRYKNPTICDEENLKLASQTLQGTRIICGDYKKVLKKYAWPGDLIFLDPPYLPISSYSDFKRYTKEQFYEEDHRELAEEVKRLQDLGCYIILMNSNHPLVYELYGQYKIEVHQTRRNISKIGTKRTGEDVLIKVLPQRKLVAVSTPIQLPEQMGKFPPTRFMGSKQNLIEHIWGVASQFPFDTVLDLFSGTGVVSYMFKVQGKKVYSNDYMVMCSLFAKALIENSNVVLSDTDIEILCDTSILIDNFVSNTFKDLYFSDEDNQFIDVVRANLSRLEGNYKSDLGLSALIRACMKKRPRGIFAYTGHRYDDGRRDLTLTLKEQFLEAINLFNGAVFDNGQHNKAKHGDAMENHQKVDLVYIDPPYFSPLSDNEYVRRYHFVEGLARDWQDVTIQDHTKTKKFKSYPTPFSSRKGAHDAFDKLFKHFRNSILLVSYSSNSLPTQDEMFSLITKYKTQVKVYDVDYRYSFANQGHRVRDIKNEVKEYLFVGC